MSTRQYRPSKLKPLLAPLMLLGFLGYFCYHGWQGDHGFVAYKKLQAQLTEIKHKHAHVKQERHYLEHLISLYKRQGLDPDLIEERAKVSLGMVKADELIILLPKQL